MSERNGQYGQGRSGTGGKPSEGLIPKYGGYRNLNSCAWITRIFCGSGACRSVTGRSALTGSDQRAVYCSE
jgi:hypothetical protein